MPDGTPYVHTDQEESPMTPTVGRIVHYRPGPHDSAAHSNGLGPDDPVAAVVTRVWSDDNVNLVVLLDAGTTTPRTSVQRAGVAPEGAATWDWPPRV